MKFELFADRVVNLDHLEMIEKFTDITGVKKELDEASLEIKEVIIGTPFQIRFKMFSGEEITLGYKTALDRDTKYNSLINGLVDK